MIDGDTFVGGRLTNGEELRVRLSGLIRRNGGAGDEVILDVMVEAWAQVEE